MRPGYIEGLDNALRRAHAFATAAVIRDGATAGFPEMLGNREIRPWGGTADGMRLLLHCGERPESALLRACARWLYQAQHRELGSWDSRGTPLTEATAMAVVALSGVAPVRIAATQRAIRFIVANQHESGGFSPSAPRRERVYSTALALWALHAHAGERVATDQSEAGITWLLRVGTTDRRDGPWPTVEGEAPSAAHTAWALFTLSLYGYDWRHPRVHGALEWLRGCTSDELEPVIELHRVGASDREIRTIHLTRALVVTALVRHGVSPLEEVVQRSLNEILESQNVATGGFGVGLDTEKRSEYVWAAARCAHAIRTVLDAGAYGAPLALATGLQSVGQRVAILEAARREQQRRTVRTRWWIVIVAVATLVVVRTEVDLALGRLALGGCRLAVAVAVDQGWYAVALSLLLSAALAVLSLIFRRHIAFVHARAIDMWRRIRP